ncbi:iron chelate uptake ABC transporter family permease subunit [Eubacterium oxidoreducens]|uniref:ABC-type Fe3+-siderophore transport system, permease component n=1 Tax=Eubacterium oxidoreducens TaxID=1732 RepID=A0A1G6A183_EUBOX|nr:iron chelate uptake ABC transporter family permease subunit [Eubacterium oxidoreducens]SDB01753.1 ABC-type Fe3+-siderophore transport system, permease component [Eubacterium oxidoreducens]
MQLTKQEVLKVYQTDKKKDQKKLALVIAVTVFIFLFCLTIRYHAYGYEDKIALREYMQSFAAGIRFLFGRIFDTDYYAQKEAVIESIGKVNYLGAFARLKETLMALLAGAAMAISGAIFQTIYKNPMASPNILGATAGIHLGNVIMVVLYSSMALEMIYTRYKICYFLTAVCVVVVLLLGKWAGDQKGNPNVMEMVMVGAIISQGINVFTQYFMYNLEDEDLLIYQQIVLGTYQQTDFISMIIFLVLMGISIIPMLLLRYYFNAAAIDYVDAKTAGINPGPIRMIGQICGVIMVTAATIHCGEIGMITMVVPYLIRAVVGADFRKVCIYSFWVGGCLLMICRLLTSFILIADEEIPVSFILNIALTPIFMIILAQRKRGFQ